MSSNALGDLSECAVRRASRGANAKRVKSDTPDTKRPTFGRHVDQTDRWTKSYELR